VGLGSGRLITALLGCAVMATACSPSATGGSSERTARAAAGPATVPSLVMTGGESGWAVWPSGHAWVLLHTDDGFRGVQNDTPPGVPTDGGLVASWGGNRLAVAVAPVERLVRSPLMTRTGTGEWMTDELPGGVVASPAAVALRPAGVTVLTTGRGGRLLTSTGNGWQDVVDARALPDASGLALDGVTWAGDALGWITGHRQSSGAVAFQTRDGGRTWTAVGAPGGSAAAALAPCGLGATWSLPELAASGRLRVLRTMDSGATWSAGRPLPASSGRPVWGCRGDEVWAVGGSGTGDRIYASSDGGATWTAEGPAPSGLTALTPTGEADGFAAGGGRSPVLWRVAGAGTAFTRIDLPRWVATVGTGTGED
jgi:hypothetical protein